jgi:hypothetical protein
VTDFAGDTSSELERKARALQWVCIVEATTYMVLLYFWLSGNHIGTAVTGSLHGFVVLTFAAMVILITRDMGWSWWYVALVLLTGPIGAVLVYERIRHDGVPEAHRVKTRRA